MPADFMEQLQKEKENLLNKENVTEIDSKRAESIQNALDKAKASSESFELLERAFNSFKEAGKDTSENIDDIVLLFNKLNNSAKSNIDSANELKRVYSENIFGGAERGVERLIDRLNDVYDSLFSVKNIGQSFDNAFDATINKSFDKTVEKGRELLKIFNDAKESLKEISHLSSVKTEIKESNQSTSTPSVNKKKQDSNTGDKIVSNINNNLKYQPDEFFAKQRGGSSRFSDSGLFSGFKKQKRELIEKKGLLRKKTYRKFGLRRGEKFDIKTNEKERKTTETEIQSLENQIKEKGELKEKEIAKMKGSIQSSFEYAKKVIGNSFEEGYLPSGYEIDTNIDDEKIKEFILGYLKKVRENINCVEEDANKEISKITEEIKNAQGEKNQIDSDLTTVKNQISSKNQSTQDYKKHIERRNNYINSANERLEFFENRLTEKKQIIEEKKSKGQDTSDEEGEINSYEKHIKKEKELIGRDKAQIAKYNEKIQSNEEIVKQLNEQKSSLEEQSSRKGGEIEAKQQVLSTLKQDKTYVVVRELEELSSESLRENTGKINRDYDTSELTAEKNVKESEFEKKSKEISTSKNIIQELNEEIIGLMEETRKVNEEFNSLKDTFNEFANFNQKTQDTIKENMDKFVEEQIKKNPRSSKQSIVNSKDFVSKLSELIKVLKDNFQKEGNKDIEEKKQVLKIRGEKNSKEYKLLEAIQKLGLESKVGELKAQNKTVTIDQIKRLFVDYSNTSTGAKNIKKNKIDENEILYGRSTSSIKLNQTLEVISKISSVAKELSDFGIKFARIRVEAARQSSSASDILDGKKTFDWGNKFDLTSEQLNQVFPAIEGFIRDNNVSLKTVTTIAENLKKSTGELKPEDLKQVLTAIQGMTQGQVNAMMGESVSMSDRYGAAFTLMENASQLDAAIKAYATGALTGETPDGLSEGDKALLENNQDILSKVDGIYHLLSDLVPSWTPYISESGRAAVKITGTVTSMYGSFAMMKKLGALDKITATLGKTSAGRGIIRSIRGLSESIKSFFGKFNFGPKILEVLKRIKLPSIGNIFGKIGGFLGKAGPIGAIIGAITSGITATYKKYERDSKLNEEQKSLNEKGYMSGADQIYLDKKKDRSSKYYLQDLLVGAITTTAGIAGGIAGSALGPVGSIAGATVASMATQALLERSISNSRAKEEREDEKNRVKSTLTKEEKAIIKEGSKGLGDSLKSMKTYQTLVKQLRSGQFTKYEDAMVKFSQANLSSIAVQGGSNAAFGVFAKNNAEFATSSFSKEMKVLNEALQNVGKGLNAHGSGRISGEHQVAVYTSLLNRQIEATKKWISAIEHSIGKYTEIPSIILNEMKNKISQFSFETGQMGGGTVAGQQEQINKLIKNNQNSLTTAFDQFASDVSTSSSAIKRYKELQEKNLSDINSNLRGMGEKEYTMSDLKNPEKIREIQNKANNYNAMIQSELERHGISRVDVEDIQNSMSIATIKSGDVESEENQKNAKKYLDKLFEASEVGRLGLNDDQKRIVRLLKNKLEKNGGEIDEDLWEEVRKNTGLLYKNQQDKYEKTLARDFSTRKTIDGWQQMSLNLQRLVSVNDGDFLASKNENKMLGGFNEISKKYSDNINKIISSSLNNPNTAFLRNVSEFEEARIGARRMSGGGFGENASNLLNATTEGIFSSISSLTESRNKMRESQEKEFKESVKIGVSKSNLSKEEQKSFMSFADKLYERKELDDKITSGTATKEDRAKREQINKELEKMQKSFSSSKRKGEFELLQKATERTAAVQAKGLMDISKAIEQQEAKLLPEFLRANEHLKNVESFVSKTFDAIANANKQGLRYLGSMGSNQKEIWGSGNAVVQATIRSGRQRIDDAKKNYDAINTKEGMNKEIQKNIDKLRENEAKKRGIRKEDVEVTSQIREKATNMAMMTRATAGETVIKEQNQALANNAQAVKDIEKAANAMSVKRQEGLNIEKAMASMVGAPLQEILRIEKENIKETFLQYENAKKRHQANLELAKNGNITQEELLESQNNMKKMQNKAFSEILGAQRSVMEQMFGRLVGTFKGQSGFAGASMYSKYGAGLSVNAQGQVMSLGSENLNAHNSYGERIMGNQLSALGRKSDVSAQKDDKTVQIIKDMSQLSNDNLTKQVDRIIEEMKKKKEKPAGAKPAEAKPAEAKPTEAKPTEAKPAEKNEVSSEEKHKQNMLEKIRQSRAKLKETYSIKDKDERENTQDKIKFQTNLYRASMFKPITSEQFSGDVNEELSKKEYQDNLYKKVTRLIHDGRTGNMYERIDTVKKSGDELKQAERENAENAQLNVIKRYRDESKNKLNLQQAKDVINNDAPNPIVASFLNPLGIKNNSKPWEANKEKSFANLYFTDKAKKAGETVQEPSKNTQEPKVKANSSVGQTTTTNNSMKANFEGTLKLNLEFEPGKEIAELIEIKKRKIVTFANINEANVAGTTNKSNQALGGN